MNEFLNQHFKDIMVYNFTADIEKELDAIAKGELEWTEMLASFYSPFHKTILHTQYHFLNQSFIIVNALF